MNVLWEGICERPKLFARSVGSLRFEADCVCMALLGRVYKGQYIFSTCQNCCAGIQHASQVFEYSKGGRTDAWAISQEYLKSCISYDRYYGYDDRVKDACRGSNIDAGRPKVESPLREDCTGARSAPILYFSTSGTVPE